MKMESNAPKGNGDAILVEKRPDILPERIPAGPTEKIPGPNDQIEIPNVKFYVSKGRAVVCKRGSLPQFHEIKESDLTNGIADIEHLIKIGAVSRGKQ